ncbi:FKBP12-associated protein [Entomortierella beljakovae]|nr:FKBP12-associated protein [Entomortierella beljakovae]
MTDIISTPSTSTPTIAPLFMNSNVENEFNNIQSAISSSKGPKNQRRNTRNRANNNDHKDRPVDLDEQSTSIGSNRHLNPKAKDFKPQTIAELDHPRGSSSRTDGNNNESTRTPYNRSNGHTSAHRRIDDTNNSSGVNATLTSTASAFRSGSSGRQNGHHHKGKSTDHSNTSSPASTTSSGRRQRNQRKDVAGRIFPSTTTMTSSKSNTSHTRTTQTQCNRRTTPRSSVLKFTHRVEEDRDLLESLSFGLTNSTYECMVCWDVVRPAHKIWNCQVCWAAFHLDCLSTWAKKSSEESNNQSSGWRCPGCQNTQVTIPRDYACFCGKVHEPVFNRYFTPHSCGELCGRTRNCSHPCNIPCHPGPCPPCGGLGPIQSCHCGNETFQTRCADVDSSSLKGKSCNRVCGELLGCGKHSCDSICHPGLCPPCKEEQAQLCYCGKHERNALCGDGELRTTIIDGEMKTGYYDCMSICHRPLACGHHKCSKTCHALDSELGECPARPKVVKSCPCGAKSVEELLLGKERTTCLDPIPVCGGACKKYLNCGHRCMEKCHLGDCPPCKMMVTIDCRCGSTHVRRICSEIGLFGSKQPACQKSCLGLRSCGKHQCTTKCCPVKSQSKIAKSGSPLHDAHVCTLICGKKLQCGVHTCQMLCHKGHCNPCLDASFDELSCSCGRTVLYPPIACGTPTPKCKYICTRERDCGHVSLTNHLCHPDSEPCPPCTLFVAKQCMCQKTMMPSVPCYTAHASCGKTCGKLLNCGQHKCTKSCHAGECTSSSSDICIQNCTKPRKSCGHKCKTTCHGKEPCPEEQPCPALVVSSCKCGNLTKEIVCGSSTETPWDGKLRIIKCNDFCLIAERNRRVALALDIDVAARGSRIPQFDDYVLDYASANMEFTLKIEKKLAEWIADSTLQTLNLPPMKGHHRKFVHELAAHYSVTSESVDVEPYRNVVIHKKLYTLVPDLLASQACRQKRQNIGISSSGVEQLRKSNIKDPINAIYLHDIVAGLTRSELSLQLSPIFGNIKYSIRWLTDDDAVLGPHPGNMTMDELEILLVRLRAGIKALAINGQICERVELCWMNKDGEVVNHTSINQSKRYFSVAQGDQLAKKAEPPKTRNAFSLLDDDEKIAASKKAEEERIIKAKEAAGTLSLEAWDEDETSTSLPKSSRSSSPISANQSFESASPTKIKATPWATVDANQIVVDDWQDFLVDDNNQ